MTVTVTVTVREGCGGLEGHSSGKEPLTLSLSLSLYIAKPTLEITCFPSNLPLQALFSISLLNEKRILDALTGFPHVVQSFALDITATKKADTVYSLFLEFASGGSLSWI